MHRMKKIGIDTSGLRSFLDPPQQSGKTTAGSGEVGYALHSHNSASITLTSKLRMAADECIQAEGHLLQNLRFNLRAKMIANRICISGRYTHTFQLYSV
jgi:putative salt-induced outer membrane protein YdiY